MVDFASGLMSFATGVVKGGIEQQRRRDERELGIIRAAEEDAATEVGILIEEARKEIQAEQNLFNKTAKNQLNNFNKIAVEYKNTPELLDDLSVLAVSRPDLFQGTDIDVIRNNVKAYFTEGEKVNPESPAFKQFEADYGVGATGSSVFTSQMDAYNAKVRSNMANLVGSNSTKLLLDEYIPAGSQIRDRTLEKYNEGRVGREDFLGTVGQFTGADVTAMPTAKADYAGMAEMRAREEVEGNFFKTPAGEIAKMAWDKDPENKIVSPDNWLRTQVNPQTGMPTAEGAENTITREQYYTNYYRERIQTTPAGNDEAILEITNEGQDNMLSAAELNMYNTIMTNKDPVGAKILVGLLNSRGVNFQPQFPELYSLAKRRTK